MVKSKRDRKSNYGKTDSKKSFAKNKKSQYRKPSHVTKLQNEKNNVPQSLENPFEIRINKVKHDVVGRGFRNDVGRPGVSRAKAYEKRKGTLLEEYKRRNKSSLLIDRRIGEKNKNLPEEDKLIRRAAVEKTRQYKKKSIFSLGDDDEVLTHKGQALISVGRYDDPREQSDSEDELLSESFVSDANFSGFLKIKPNDDSAEFGENENGESKKSRDEIIKELILASKKRKFDKAKESDENYEKIQNLDDEFKNPEFKSLLNQLQAPKSFKSSNPQINNASSVEQLLNQIRSGYNNSTTSEAPVADSNALRSYADKKVVGPPLKPAVGHQTSEEKESVEYDRLVRELQLESQKARPSDLAKTTAQQADDDRETLVNQLRSCTALSDILKSETEAALDSVFQSKGADKTKLPDVLSSLIGFMLKKVDYGPEANGKLPVLSASFKIFIDIILPHMHSLLVSNSVGCTKRFLEHLIQAREEFVKTNCRQISAKTIALLQVCPTLFPTDDSRHWVLNPAANFLLFAISQGKFKTIQGAFRILHMSCILFDIVQRSKRYCPEVLSFLWSILLCFCPNTAYNSNLTTPNVRKARSCFVSVSSDADADHGCDSDQLDTESRTSEEFPTDESDDADPDVASKAKSGSGNTIREVQEKFLLLTLDTLEKYIILYEYLPSTVEIFKPIQLTLLEMKDAREWTNVIELKIEAIVQRISNLKGEKQFLRIAAAKPKPLKLYEPQIDEDFSGTRRKNLPRNLQERARLSYKVKKEIKSAVREIKSDNSFLAREQLREQLQMDAARKRKVKELLGSLANQEGDYQKMKKKK